MFRYLSLFIFLIPSVLISQDAESPEDRAMAAKIAQVNQQAIQLFGQGKKEQSLVMMKQALELRQKLYPKSKYPNGHPELATGFNNVGFILSQMARYEEALTFLNKGLDLRRKLYPNGHYKLFVSLNNIANLLRDMGDFENAILLSKEALDKSRQFYPKSKFPQGHEVISVQLYHYASLLFRQGQLEKAIAYSQECLAINRKLYPPDQFPRGYSQLSENIHQLGLLYNRLGRADKALVYFQESLENRRKLYPKSKYPHGHHLIATSLDALAGALDQLGKSEQALAIAKECLEMRQKLYSSSLYPNGHRSLAASTGFIGDLYWKKGELNTALEYLTRALAMFNKLHPNGHSDILITVQLIAQVHKEMGHFEEALKLTIEASAQARKLYPTSSYPNGHPLLAGTLYNTAEKCRSMGKAKKGFPLIQEALRIHQSLRKQELLNASEVNAFAKLFAHNFAYSYLSTTNELKRPPGETYKAIWPSRSILSRFIQQRYANFRSAGEVATENLNKLKDNRRQMEKLLLDSRLKQSERDKRLTKLTNERDVLERKLISVVPHLKRWSELDQLGPEGLLSSMPTGVTFIDFLPYSHHVFDKKTKKTISTKKYAVFVLSKGQPIQRIELTQAKQIDNSIAAWRNAINTRQDDRTLARQVHDQVWSKIAKQLPKDTKTIYLAPDGELARLPWAALPTGKKRILLEDYAIAIVPHGAYLLESIRYPRTFSGEPSTLLMGNIEYHSKKWPDLPGTATELKALKRLITKNTSMLTGKEATAKALTKLLPKVQYAHLATHGFFDDDALNSEKKYANKAREKLQFSADSLAVAADNPLGFVGLLLARGEVMSGLSLIDLRLDDLHLVTLSACETGLGEQTSGAGVQTLQNAFHLAGCANVVASLWQVNDDSTSALMSVFYHELLIKKKPLIEALRTAQLYLYYNPTQVDILVKRGPPKLGVVATAPKVDPAKPRPRRAATKDWAAFVLSGLGK